MGEQNRRSVEVERPPGDVADTGSGHRPGASAGRPGTHGGPRDREGERALGPLADERQTRRQAPSGAAPGESAEEDTIG